MATCELATGRHKFEVLPGAVLSIYLGNGARHGLFHEHPQVIILLNGSPQIHPPPPNPHIYINPKSANRKPKYQAVTAWMGPSLESRSMGVIRFEAVGVV